MGQISLPTAGRRLRLRGPAAGVWLAAGAWRRAVRLDSEAARPDFAAVALLLFPVALLVASVRFAFRAAGLTASLGRGPTLRTTGASDFPTSLGGVLFGYSQRSAMMHFGHAGVRATQT